MALLDQIVLYISILIATPRISYLLPWQIIIHTHTPISVQCTQWGGVGGRKDKVIYIMCLPAESLMAKAFVLHSVAACDGQEAAVSLCSMALFSNLDPS